MRYFIAFVLLLASLPLSAQKIKLEDTFAYVDQEPYLYYERKNMATEASIHGLQTETDEIFVIFREYKDPNQITSSNPEGKVRWIEINFLTINQRCEVASNTHKSIVKLLLDNEVYQNGVFNPESAERLARKYGTTFSDNRPGSVHIHIHD